ncbi:hypothetical protein [Bradyrhizobium sp. B024]|uniref:hypothetical protein n=1 Tax=Bradyrhizobium sp. B024 TaxID=3140247 RepID=UPI001B40951B|nr:hypothetical protein [Bradyrhizobium japonicum]
MRQGETQPDDLARRETAACHGAFASANAVKRPNSSSGKRLSKAAEIRFRTSFRSSGRSYPVRIVSDPSFRDFFLSIDGYHGRNLRIAEEYQEFKQGASTIDGQKLQAISLSGMREDAAPGSQASRRCQALRRHLQ